jgi:hypothetical protein
MNATIATPNGNETSGNSPIVTVDSSSKKKSFWTVFFDKFDSIDRALYGKRLTLFVWGALIVLIISPIFDALFEVSRDRVTYWTTLLYLIFLLVLLLSWISIWRDDEGNFTRKRFLFQLKMYLQSFNDSIKENKGKTWEEYLYQAGSVFIVASICWRALQNVSVFIRKPIEALFECKIGLFRSFETVTHNYWWILLSIGIALIVIPFFFRSNFHEKIWRDIKCLLFNWRRKGEKVGVIKTKEVGFVIDVTDKQQVSSIIKSNQYHLFKELVSALQKWNPRNCYYEYEFQIKLQRHLGRHLSESIIEREKPIGSKEDFNRGRADIIIDDTILIELKKDTCAGAVQRAKGQIGQYAEIWRQKGPVILVLCNYDYTHAKATFTSVMSDLNKGDKNALTFVIRPN